jgi:hypothetical protein
VPRTTGVSADLSAATGKAAGGDGGAKAFAAGAQQGAMMSQGGQLSEPNTRKDGAPPVVSRVHFQVGVVLGVCVSLDVCVRVWMCVCVCVRMCVCVRGKNKGGFDLVSANRTGLYLCYDAVRYKNVDSNEIMMSTTAQMITPKG